MKRVTLVQLSDGNIVAELSQRDEVNGSVVTRNGLVPAFDEVLTNTLEEFFDEDNILT